MALEKATIVNVRTNEKLSVRFNPEEYSLSRENTFAQAQIPGRSSPLLQFAHGNLSALELELLFDTHEERRDVREETGKLIRLLAIDPETHAPPILLFVWGSLRFECVLARASQKFVLFMPNGNPVRARIQVSFQEYTNGSLEAKEVKRQTADYTRTHLVGQGETLSGIATKVYNDPTLWRPLAIQNQIENPRRLDAGRRIAVPRLPYRDQESGEVYG
jgi:nucleoid-associated protein YgaU